MLRAAGGGAFIGSVTLAICVLDYLAYLRPLDPKNDKNGRADYIQIIRDFLVRIDQRYVPTDLYAVRCSLVHAYAPSKAMKDAGLDNVGMAYCAPADHLRREGGSLLLNIDTFLADVAWASHEFFDATDGSAIVEARGNQLLLRHSTRTGRIAGYDEDAENEALEYGQMHPALREFDSDSPSIDRLRQDVSALFEE